MAYISIDGVRIAYDDVGSGPPVLLLHGYPFNRSLWLEQVTALAQTCRVITLDFRGHGQSESSPGPTTMERLAQDVALLLDSLAVSKAVIGGISMGGYVTLSFYRHFRDRVSSLLLVDTRAQADTEEGKQVRANQIQTIRAEGMAPIVDAMLPKLLHPETVSKRPELVKRIREMMLRTAPEGAIAALEGMAIRSDQSDLLREVTVPTLIIAGRDDPIAPVTDSERMHHAISDSRLVVIDKAAHLSNVERVEEFNQAVTRFLDLSPGR